MPRQFGIDAKQPRTSLSGDEYRRALMSMLPATPCGPPRTGGIAAVLRRHDVRCHVKEGINSEGRDNRSVAADLGMTRQVMEEVNMCFSPTASQRAQEELAPVAPELLGPRPGASPPLAARAATPLTPRRAGEASAHGAVTSRSATPNLMCHRAVTPLLTPRSAPATGGASAPCGSRLPARAMLSPSPAGDAPAPLTSPSPRAATGLRALTPCRNGPGPGEAPAQSRAANSGSGAVGALPTAVAGSSPAAASAMRAATPSSRPGSRACGHGVGARAAPSPSPSPASPSRPRSSLGGGVTPSAAEATLSEREAEVRRSFRHPRKQVAARFELLSRAEAYFKDVGRRVPAEDGNQGRTFLFRYFARQNLSDARGTRMGTLLQRFEQSKIGSLPLMMHPSNSDFYAAQDGGCARTSELLSALAVLNFHRWLCGLVELRLCTFRQALADLVAQTLRSREVNNGRLESETKVHDFADAFAKFTQLPVPSVHVCADMPSAVGGVCNLLTNESSVQRVPAASAAIASLMPPPRTKRIALETTQLLRVQDPLWAYRPLMHYGEGKLNRDLNSAGGPLREAPMSIGEANFRRALLDPRLRHTGIVRRGCRTCIWTAPFISGEPNEIFSDSRLEPDFLDRESMAHVAGEKRRRASDAARHFEGWRKSVMEKMETERQSRASSQVGWSASIPGVASFKTVATRVRRASATQSSLASSIRASRLRATSKFDSMEDFEVEDQATSLRKLAALDSEDAQSVEDGIPTMVCYPPSGYVPIESMDSPNMPWTVSPDPGRFAPTMKCSVSMYRVRINVDAGTADRVGGAIPLADKRIDCGGSANSGTPFCIIFAPAFPIRAGDQFEVELTGLRRCPASEPACLRYFVSFEQFRPQPEGCMAWPQRVLNLKAFIEAPHVMNDVAVVVQNATDGIGAKRRGSLTRRRGRRSMKPRKPKPTMRGARAEGATLYDEKNPPPIGVARHPDEAIELNVPHGYIQAELATEDKYDLETESNEIIVVLAIPRNIVVRPQLSAFVPSHSKWETVPNAVWTTYVERTQMPAADTAAFPAWEDSTWARQISAVSYGTETTAQDDGSTLTRRLLIKVMLPFPCLYELRMFWGYLPKEATIYAPLANPSLATFSHPLTINVNALPGLRALVPYAYHSSIMNFGYPKKHILADHFGIAVVGPLRYRLRRGFVRFSVHVKQGSAEAAFQSTAGSKMEASGSELLLRQGSSEASGSSSGSSYATPRSRGLHGGRGFGTPRAADDHSSGFSSSSDGEGQGFVAPEKTADPNFVRAIPIQAQKLLQACTAQGTAGSVVIVAVVGIWRRVEVLQRRELPAPPLPEALRTELRNREGSIVAAAVEEEMASAWKSELHECVLHLTEEDMGQLVQLYVFQVGLTAAATASLQSTPEAFAAIPADIVDEQLAPELGASTAPSRWCLAEFVVDTTEPQGFDEQEMQKLKGPLLNETDLYERRMEAIIREIVGIPTFCPIASSRRVLQAIE
eukprot:TRINITY_DN11486_c0_g1_i1.p1 TRINITY_DN11486_c0_g1~~TRINITY_DN11486_c0_g1_i1.p1  ORF type:complete len:1489 (-),score=249.96 TRINITY_DN11486_c0_g1_i1:110-4576(-)